MLNYVSQMFFNIVAILMAITAHEWAHAVVSHRLGDPTPEAYGRLSLNPLVHIDWLGFLALVLLHFGWAKPVPVNPSYYKNPRKGMRMVALAGVGINLILAVISALILAVVLVSSNYGTLGMGTIHSFRGSVAFLNAFMVFNLVLTVCNLIPVPPLDGFQVWLTFLPQQWGVMLSNLYDRYRMFFFFLVILGFQFIVPPLVNGLVKIFWRFIIAVMYVFVG